MKKWKLGAFIALFALFIVACGTKKEADNKDVTPEATNEVTPEATATPEPTPEPTATPAPTATPKPTATPIPEVSETYKEVLGAYDLKAGTCMSAYMASNAECQEFIRKHFNSITFENELKPDYILDQAASKAAGEIVVKFHPDTEKLLKWCQDNNMAVRGHTLIWHSQTPQWIFYDNFDTNGKLVGREEMLKRMESYIRQVFELLEKEGYLDMFYAYDVLNEAWMEDGSRRQSNWLTTIGEDYMWQAFYFADKYAPEHVDLYYNDYNEQFKTETLYNFLQTLVDENGEYLVDGIGFQAHLYTKDDLNTYFNTVERIGSLGLKSNLTELDVCLGTWQKKDYPFENNLKEQGRYYYNLLTGLMQRVEEGKVTMDSLTFWGFTDQLSWRKEYNPLMLNISMKPKYAYYGALMIKEYAGFDEAE